MIEIGENLQMVLALAIVAMLFVIITWIIMR